MTPTKFTASMFSGTVKELQNHLTMVTDQHSKSFAYPLDKHKWCVIIITNEDGEGDVTR